MSRPLFIGTQRLRPEQTDSTNTWLRAYLDMHPGVPEGLVVVTPYQTAGRGQQGRVWLAPKGQNLTASILLKPAFMAANDLFWLNKAVALAVRDTLAAFLPDPVIKWPNDVYAAGKKVAGILIESSVSSKVQWVIAGIGINVLQTEFDPETPLAASIKSLGGAEISVETVLDALCTHLEQRYLQVRSGRFNLLDEQYHAFLMGKDTLVRFTFKGEVHTGMLFGVDETGKLLIKSETQDACYQVGEISLLL